MNACPACGRDNPDDASFCNGCGAPLAARAPAREVRKTVTVLFADVTGSTALGERLDPEAVRRVMARWFDVARAVLERHGGTVEKFVGDAVMAVFGIPTLHEDDALRAVRAAGELRESLAELNVDLERDHGVRLEVRTGVNTGEVVAGEGQTLATGDAVNVAARLEQAAAPGEILLGGRTLSLVSAAVEAEVVEPLALKGKSEQVSAVRLLAVRRDTPGFERRLDAPMVGREGELAQLRQAYRRASDERAPYLFTVLGVAGIGKSRLTQEFLGEVRGEATVLRGRCLPYGEGITYWPLAEMLQEAAHHELRARLLELLAGEPDAELIAARLVGTLGAAAAGTTSEETAWAVRKLFERLARERPLVVVFDDLHWAEPTLFDLVDHLVDWSRGAPMLVLCLARPELLEARPGWGGGKLNATSMLLEPLSEGESVELIEELLGESELAPRLRARIAEAAEGNPLFVEQMLALLREGGVERELVVPPTIQALLAARLDRLARDERAVIERAAVEGKVFHRSAVAELATEELRPEVGSHLLSLVRKELIRPEPDAAPDDDAFRFRHLLIRDAAYEALPKEERAQLHERFAEWLERRAGTAGLAEVEEIVGYHLEQAYRYRAELGPVGETELALARRAGARVLAAGRRALARADLPAASALLERAARLLPPDDPERLALLPDLAEVHLDGGNLTRAEELAVEALAAGDARVRAHGALARALVSAQTGGAMDSALADIEQAAGELERLGDLAGLAKAARALGRMRFFLGHAEEAEAEYMRAAELARRAGVTQIELEALDWALGAKLYGPAPVDEGIAYADEVLRRALGNAHLDAFALTVRGNLTAMLGRFDEAREFVARGKRLADELGLVLRRGVGSLQEGDTELLAGNLEAAELALREGSAILESVGEIGFRSTVDGQLAEVLLRAQRDEEAEALAREVLSYAMEDDVEPQAQARCVVAIALAHRGEHAEAKRLAREAVAIMQPTDYLVSQGNGQLALADVLRQAGLRSEAAEAALAAAELYERKGNLVLEARAKALLDDLSAPA